MPKSPEEFVLEALVHLGPLNDKQRVAALSFIFESYADAVIAREHDKLRRFCCRLRHHGGCAGLLEGADGLTWNDVPIVVCAAHVADLLSDPNVTWVKP